MITLQEKLQIINGQAKSNVIHAIKPLKEHEIKDCLDNNVLYCMCGCRIKINQFDLHCK